jgi:hypothetical protein
MSAQRINKASKDLFIFVAFLFILYLTAINISSFSKQKTKVLGAEIEIGNNDKETVFWNDFLVKHPNYVPGWIEIGRMDKAREIDPNYF